MFDAFSADELTAIRLSLKVAAVAALVVMGRAPGDLVAVQLAFGAAAAVAHALGLNPDQIAQAVQVAACQLPMSLYLPVRSGATARNTYLGHAAQLGQSAALAVASGITAPAGALAEYAQIGLGKPPLPWDDSRGFQLLHAYFKPYAAVRHVHYGALATQALRMSLEVSKIDRVVLQVYEEATIYCGNRAPQTPLQAQFSLSFGLAAMLRWGRLDPWVYREPQFHDPLLRALEAKVQGDLAAWFGSLPAVPAACKDNALLGAEGCKTNGFDNFDKIAFWKTPQAEGGKFVPYSRWTQDYIAIMGGR